MPKLKISNLKQLDKFAGDCVPLLTAPCVILLKGDLAVGKTQLVQCIAPHLGVPKGLVSSPTFTLINSYPTKGKQEIYHCDLFRIKSDRELEELAFWDLFEASQPIFIEWPERVINSLPESWNKLLIELKFLKNKKQRQLEWQFLD